MSVLTSRDELTQVVSSQIQVTKDTIWVFDNRTKEKDFSVEAVILNKVLAIHKAVAGRGSTLTHIRSGLAFPLSLNSDYDKTENIYKFAVAVLKSGCNLEFDYKAPEDTLELLKELINLPVTDLSQRYGDLSFPVPCQCSSCNEEIDEPDDAVTVNAGLVCESCLDDEYSICESCDSWTERDEIRSAYDGNSESSVCEDCLDRNYWHCDDCGDYYHDRNNTQYSIEDTRDTVCESCYTNSGYFCCDSCNNCFTEDSYHSNGECNDCHVSDADLSDPEDWCDDYIHYSSYKGTTLGFLGNPQDEIYLGVELELLTGSSDYPVTKDEYRQIARHTDSLLSGFAILKADSSLDSLGGGFEICTAPASLDIHQQWWTKFGDRHHDSLDTNDGAGLHVHISRKPLNDLTIGKLLVLVNSWDNRHFMETLADRNNAQYAAFCPGKTVDNIHSNDRYEALNVTNGSTIEFRLFRSRLAATQILACIEFCHASANYCSSCGLRELSWVDLSAYIIQHGESYPHLYEWLESYVTEGLLNGHTGENANTLRGWIK